MSGRLLFTTDALPERDRYSAFCEEIVRRYTGLEFGAEDHVDFRAAIELQRVDAVDIGFISTTPFNSARTQSLVLDGDDSILVTLVTHGRGYQTQRETDRELAPGDGIICDCAYPGELNFLTDSRFWHLKIPRGKLSALLPGLASFAGAKLDRDHVARRLLFEYLRAAFDMDLNGRRAGRLYEEHLVGLVALALGAERGTHEIAERPGIVAVRRAAVLHEIDNVVGHANANAAMIAARLGITPRYLRKLLEQTGRSLSEHLLERRLDRAAALLRDPGRRNSRIAAIAFAAGFGDLSYFNRAFRRRYGVTPSDMRQASRPGANAV